jgi:hypothetical protein
MGLPVPGSAEEIVTGLASIAAMPSASIAHIENTAGPPSIRTRCGVGAAENG